MTLLLMFPQGSAEAARQAMRLWAIDVVPFLFPYMVICRALSAQFRKNHLPSAAVVLPLSLLGGSPSGAAILSEYAEDYNAHRLRSFCALTGTMSPMFLLNTAGGWLKAHTPITGGMLLTAHWGGAVLSFLLITFSQQGGSPYPSTPENARVSGHDDSVSQSVSAILQVGGCMVFYSVISSLCAHLPGISRTTLAVIHAFLEAGGGLYALSTLDIPPITCAALFAAASSFSGFSVLSQNYVFLKPAGVQFHSLLLSGLLRAVCSAAIMLIMYTCSIS